MDGKAFDGASLQRKPVLIWFWAPWCPTCRSQMPQVQRLEQSSFVLLDGRGEIKFRTGYGGSEALPDKVAAVAN